MLRSLHPSRTRCTADRGGQFAEYAAVLLLIAFLASVVLVAGGVPQKTAGLIEDAFCKVASLATPGSSDCGDSEDEEKLRNEPLCTDKLVVRDQTISGSLFAIRGEQRGMDYLTYQTDPVTGDKEAIYSTHGTTSAGAEYGNMQKLSKKLKAKNKPQWEAFVEAGWGMRNNYKFEGDDSWDKAKSVREKFRGSGFSRWAHTALGAAGPAIDDAYTTVAEKIESGWALITGGDQEEVDKKYEKLTPESVTLDLNARGSAEGSYELGKKGALSAEAEGDVDLTLRNLLEIDKNFNRTHEVWFDLDANAYAKGGLDFSKILPAKFRAGLSAGGGGRLVQRTKFDSDGNPQRVDFELRYEGGAGTILEAGPDIRTGKAKLSKNTKKRLRAEHVMSLDLTKPRNRDAYGDVYNLDSGMMAVPNPAALVNGDAVDLGERFRTKGTETYETFDLTVERGTDADIQVGGFGGGVESETKSANLDNFYYRDNSAAGDGWNEYDC